MTRLQAATTVTRYTHRPVWPVVVLPAAAWALMALAIHLVLG